MISGHGADYPCDAVDVELAVTRLRRAGVLSRGELLAMVARARQGMRPDGTRLRAAQERLAASGLRKLERELRARGIVDDRRDDGVR